VFLRKWTYLKNEKPDLAKKNEVSLEYNCCLTKSPFFVIFAVLDVSLAVNLCINCSFFTFINDNDDADDDDDDDGDGVANSRPGGLVKFFGAGSRSS